MGDKKEQNIKLRLREVMEAKGVKGKDLASFLETKRETTVSDWVTGKTIPSLSKLKIIADFLNVEPHELIELSDKFDHIYNDKKQWKGILPKCE
jgi:transcriptional regulator with XRE-family HTH domain